LVRLGLQLSYRQLERRFGFQFAALREHQSMPGLRRVLDAAGAPLILGPGEAHVTRSAAGWRGGDLLRLRAKMIRADADLCDRAAG
jgi:hypothetical protein